MIGQVVAALLLIATSVEVISAATCACGKVTVHIRSGPGTSHGTIGNIYPGFCYQFKGDESKASGYEWAHIDYNGKDGWVAENYVDLKACPSSVTTHPNTGTHTGFNDVGYSFLIGEDGNAYEGRGWDIVGAHTKGYNSVGLGFCMMGNFMERLPDSKALVTVQKLIACGVSKGKIQSNYILRGHRDVGATACPGTKLYALIKTWPHY